MSWLLKSLSIDDPDSSSSASSVQSPAPPSAKHAPTSGGVKEDLSVFGQVIGRQLQGFAAFLAPPPQSSSSPPSVEAVSGGEPRSPDSSSQRLLGIRNDLAEIGGSFKNGFSILSSNKAVVGISKFASNLLQFSDQEEEEESNYDDDESGDIPGITEDVVDFVKEISSRPEYWRDFPISLDKDFKMSNFQREHVSAVKQLVPSISALRESLHTCMEDEKFWLIYFILLLPRLNEHDLELLSAPKIVETRDLLLEKLQKKRRGQVEISQTLRAPVVSDQQTRNASSSVKEGEIYELKKSFGQPGEKKDIDACPPLAINKNLDGEEGISFSDLEDDGDNLSGEQYSHGASQSRRTSVSGSSDWVQLNRNPESRDSLYIVGDLNSQGKESEGEVSSDWLAIDDSD